MVNKTLQNKFTLLYLILQNNSSQYQFPLRGFRYLRFPRYKIKAKLIPKLRIFIYFKLTLKNRSCKDEIDVKVNRKYMYQ